MTDLISIDDLLARRNTSRIGMAGSHDLAFKRLEISKLLAKNYVGFNELRKHLIHPDSQPKINNFSRELRSSVELLENLGWVRRVINDCWKFIQGTNSSEFMYIKGIDALNYIFGADSDTDHPSGLSGEIAFHDAWWIPDSGGGSHKNKPFAEDVLTPHHSEYYGSEGKTPATDLDSPVPNALIGVRGSFLFTLEGEPLWIKLAIFMLQQALSENGIGAKTAAGYGYLKDDASTLKGWTDKLSKKSAEDNFAQAKLSLNVGSGEIKATLIDSNKTTAPVKGEKAQVLLAKLPEDQRKGKKIKEGKLLVEVKVREVGSKLLELLDLQYPE